MKNKNKNEQKQAKPFTAQENRQPTPLKKLKEMSQEMYRELQQEMQQEPERQQQTVQRPQVVAPRELIVETHPVAVEVPSSSRKTRDKSTDGRKTRQQSNKSSSERLSVTNKTVDLLPKTEQDIMKGIIFSEIFGPPKSKR